MNRTIRPFVAFAILILLVIVFVAGTVAATCTSGTASAVTPPTLTGWVDSDMRQQWALSWTPERVPAGLARCDVYMGGRPASRNRKAYNNVTVDGHHVVGVIAGGAQQA